jgi:DNA-binding NarL/FixJ family response regulator
MLKLNFDFTKTEYEHLKEELMLNDEMAKILEMKIKGYSITKMSMELNMCERNVNKKIKQLKEKIMRVI